MKEERLRIYQLDFSYITELLNWWNNPPMNFSVPTFHDLPNDAKVIAVYVNHSRGCLDVVIESEAFEPIDMGEELPRRKGQLSYFRVGILDSMSCQATEDAADA